MKKKRSIFDDKMAALIQWAAFALVLIIPMIMVRFEPEMTLRVVGIGLRNTVFFLFLVFVLFGMIHLKKTKKEHVEKWKKSFFFVVSSIVFLIVMTASYTFSFYKGFPDFMSNNNMREIEGVLDYQSKRVGSNILSRSLYIGENTYSFPLPSTTRVGQLYRFTLYPKTNWIIKADKIDEDSER